MKLSRKILISFLGLFLAFENIVLALFTSMAINILSSGKAVDLVKLSIITIISLAVIFAIKVLFQKVKNEEIGKMNVNSRKDIMRTLLSGSTKEFSMNMLFNDIKFLEDNYYNKKISQYLEVTSFLLSLIVSLILGWQATIIIVSLSFISMLLPKLSQNKLTKKTNEWSKENSQYMNIVKDIFNGNKAIQNYSSNDYFYDKHNVAVLQLEERNISLKVFQKVVEFLTFSCSHFAIISMILASGWLVTSGNMAVGSIIGIIQLSNSITFPIVNFVQNRNLIRSATDILDKQKGFIQLHDESNDKQSNFNDPMKEIQLSNVNYKINDSNILENINLTIRKGEKLLIVGPSGSGKSTLLSLLNGDNWDGMTGSVTINNERVDPTVFKNLTTRIMQDYYIFEDTLKNNICFGKTYNEKQVENAIYEAQLSELVEKNGLDYYLTENGKNVSGGQKQRIEIARSLINNKPVLLIDEGLSSLDKKTSEVIEESFLNNKEMTVVHITHHVNEKFVDVYDKIITIKNGKMLKLSSMEGNE